MDRNYRRIQVPSSDPCRRIWGSEPRPSSPQALEQDDVVGDGVASDREAFAVARPSEAADGAVVHEVREFLGCRTIEWLHPKIASASFVVERDPLAVWR